MLTPILVVVLLTSSYTFGNRLPRTIRPEHYNLRVLTYLGGSEGFKFRGHVTIQMTCLEDTSNVTLHSKDLKLDEKQIKLVQNSGSGKTSINVERIQYNKDNDFIVLHTSTKLTRNSRFELTIPFSGVLGTGTRGYFRSSYFDKQRNATLWITATNFAPTYARTAFPCFDEPDRKATFNVSLGHHRRFNALSNMPLRRTEPLSSAKEKDWVIDHFEKTTPMATYLVAYSVNDFEKREVKNGVVYRVWARREAMDQVEYALGIASGATRFYEGILGQRYPLGKMDLVALPDYLENGMDCLGLLMLRESRILFHPNVSTASDEHTVTVAVTRLVAQVWFGNLVTMKWWSDLWLNEGIAHYVARMAVDHLQPEWNSLVEDTEDEMLELFELDDYSNNHLDKNETATSDEILALFSNTVTLRSASLIKMMVAFLGEDTFWSGLKLYLERHSYGNVVSNDLWDAMTNRSQVALPSTTLKEVMESWTLHTGYPIVTVNRDYESNTAKITQVRYVPAPNRVNNASCWWIPLTYTTSKDPDFSDTRIKEWITCRSSVSPMVTIENLPSRDHWVIFNVQMAGYYRIQYDKQNYNLLVKQLNSENFKQIGVLNRAQLIDDALDISWISAIDDEIFFAIVNYIYQETEYLPWKATLNNFGYQDCLLKPTPLYQTFYRYIRSILEPIYDRLQIFNNDQPSNNQMTTNNLRSLIAKWSCKFQVGDCITQSVTMFANWMATSKNNDLVNPIPRDLRSAVYCTAIAQGNTTEWNFLLQRFHASSVASEREIILQSLACSQDAAQLRRFLESSIDASARLGNAPLIFTAVARNDVGYPVANEFLRRNFERIYNHFSADPWSMSRYLKPIAECIFTEDKLSEFEAFVRQNKRFFLPTSVEQALENTEINQRWKRTRYESFERALLKAIDCNRTAACLEVL